MRVKKSFLKSEWYPIRNQDCYDEGYLNDSVNNDRMSAGEAGFMWGYLDSLSTRDGVLK